MTMNKSKSGLSMKKPSAYQIRVLGHLYESWSNRLGGMKVVEYRDRGGQVETVLQGHLADQAALAGVLNALYEMHLPIISAEYLEEDPSPIEISLDTDPR